MTRVFLLLGGVPLLAGCDDTSAPGAEGQQAGTPVTAGGTVPPRPATPVADTRFPLPYPTLVAPTFAVGQDVEILYQDKWVPARVTEVADIDGKQQVRTTYPGQTSPIPHLIMSNTDGIRLPTGRTGADLRIGLYSCFDGERRPDLAFRVAAYGQYTDPYGENPGSFTTAGETITFRGGKFNGLTAQRLTSNGFYFTPQASCSWEMQS